ncbi:Phthalate 4,5-dioxygenase oxygenase subunit [compost metagenome]
MLDAVRVFQQGGEAIGTGANAIPADVCAFQTVVPKTDDWRTFNVQYVWAGGQDLPELEPSYSVTA